MRQIKKNQTWKLVPRPTKENVIETKWVSKNKLNENGEVIRNTTRLKLLNFILLNLFMIQCVSASNF